MKRKVVLDFPRILPHSVIMKKLLFATILLAFPAYGQTVGPETGAPLPRFESLKFNEVNLRRGAGEDYPIAWKFRLYGLPVEIFQEFRDWRHIRDHEGATGWIHKTQLGTARTALTRQNISNLHSRPETTSDIVARIESGVVIRLINCLPDWCRGKVKGYRGWIHKKEFWGIPPEDVFGN